MADKTHLALVEAVAHATELDRAGAVSALGAATAAAIQDSGRGLDLTEADLTGFDLQGVSLRRATLNRTTFHGTNLHRADLSEVTMICPGMERTNLSYTQLTGAYVHALALQTCNLENADLSDLRDATGTLFHGCRLRHANLTNAHLSGATFYQCDLSRATLRGTDLQGAVMNECLLLDADLSAALVDQFTVTKSGLNGTSLAGAHGSDCRLQRLTSADGLTLDDASLPHLSLSGIRATGWSAIGLSAPGADLINVTIHDADFQRADLSDARLLRCSLPAANLDGALLSGASITSCTLRKASLVAARAENLHIVESDLSGVNAALMTGRCLSARDVDLSGASFVNANLYRAMLTGDPPEGMRMTSALLDGAVLVQAYVAADLTEASLLNVNAAYSRFSQSSLRGARLDRANLYQATMVKVDVTGASMAGVRAPVFADRCPGVHEALGRPGQDAVVELSDFLRQFAALLARTRTGST